MIPLPTEYAVFLGMQEMLDGAPDLELWNLTRAIPGHPVNSTVTRATLDAALALIGGAS